MYDELTTDLRRAANTWLAEEYKVCAEAVRYLLKESAEAIEDLQQQVEHYHGCMLEWFGEAQEYKAAYIAEHEARIAEVKRLYDAFYEGNKKAVELTPLKIVLPQPPKEEQT